MLHSRGLPFPAGEGEGRGEFSTPGGRLASCERLSKVWECSQEEEAAPHARLGHHSCPPTALSREWGEVGESSYPPCSPKAGKNGHS